MSDLAAVRRQHSAGSDIQRTLIVLAAWFFLAVWLSVTGKLVTHGGLPLGILATIVLPLLVYAGDGRAGHPLFGGLLRLDLQSLIAAQTFRILGVTFIVAWLGGKLPGGFALPAGIGDIAVGLLAPFVASAVARRPERLAPAWIFTLLGVTDLVIAVGSGVLHGGPPLGLLAGAITTDAVTRYPLSLIPTFGVPLALLLHVRTFQVLAATRTQSTVR
jgi:hypothetical protein